MDIKWWVGVILSVWSSTVATMALVHTLRKDKKTALRVKPSKHHVKRK